MPQISSNLRVVTIKLKDTLQPNSTYYIQFGNAIRDVNEGNVAKDFSYVFSTGDHIDSMTLSGRVLMAETGKADSTCWSFSTAIHPTVRYKPANRIMQPVSKAMAASASATCRTLT